MGSEPLLEALPVAQQAVPKVCQFTELDEVPSKFGPVELLVLQLPAERFAPPSDLIKGVPQLAGIIFQSSMDTRGLRRLHLHRLRVPEVRFVRGGGIGKKGAQAQHRGARRGSQIRH